jgi:hypothetical protein
MADLRKDAASFAGMVSATIGGYTPEEGETFVEAHVMLSVASALKGPDAEKWQKVIDKEEARLLAFDTWKPITDQQMGTMDQVLPIAIILTIKRCGTYKARACV